MALIIIDSIFTIFVILLWILYYVYINNPTLLNEDHAASLKAYKIMFIVLMFLSIMCSDIYGLVVFSGGYVSTKGLLNEYNERS